MAIKRNQTCSVRDFALGCIETYDGRGSSQVTREHGVYIVRGHTSARKHVVEGTKNLGKARKLARATAK